VEQAESAALVPQRTAKAAEFVDEYAQGRLANRRGRGIVSAI